MIRFSMLWLKKVSVTGKTKIIKKYLESNYPEASHRGILPVWGQKPKVAFGIIFPPPGIAKKKIRPPLREVIRETSRNHSD